MSYNSAFQGYANGVTGGGASPTILTVTNLNNSGSGSLRVALEASGARRVEFSVSGNITIGPARINITNNDITVDFSTAPDKGIQLIAHADLTQAPIRILADNVEILYMRSRPGTSTSTPDCIQLNGSDGVMFHHCELMFGTDENVDLFITSTNTTFQWCIIAWGLNIPSTSLGFLMAQSTTNISIHHCLFANNHGRNPRWNCPGPIDNRNCIIYNPVDHPMTSGSALAEANYVGGVYIQGPDSTRDYFLTTDAPDGGDIYHNDNIGATDFIRPDALADFNVLGSPVSGPPAVDTIPSEYVVEYILPYIGAILPLRDSLTQQIIDNVIDDTGAIIGAPSDVGGYPVLTATTNEYRIISISNVTGASITLTKYRVEFYSSNSLVHTEDFIIHLDTQRLWGNGGPTVTINKSYAIREIMIAFEIAHRADLLVLPATTNLSAIMTDAVDPDGWLADTGLIADTNVRRILT